MGQIDNLRTEVVGATINGDGTLVTGVAGRSILVKSLSLTFATAAAVTFYSGPSASGTALSGAFDMQANSSMYEGDHGDVVYRCNPGEDFVLHTGSSSDVEGYVKYQLL